MKRLNNKQIKARIKEYNEEHNGDREKIAIELAKDFIYNAQLEFEQYLNKNYKEYWPDIFRDRGNIREQAINETAEYIKDI